MKYKVIYWLNADFIAEEIIDEENINFKNNDLGKYNEPTKNAKYKILDLSILSPLVLVLLSILLIALFQ